MAEETLDNITENENYNTLNEINADENLEELKETASFLKKVIHSLAILKSLVQGHKINRLL